MRYTGDLPNPGYVLMYAHSPDEAIAQVELIGPYLVIGFATEFPVASS